MNKIQEFFSEQFGTVRTVNVNGQVYFVGIDIAKALGYSNAAKAVSTHCKRAFKTEIDVSSQNGKAHKAQVIIVCCFFTYILNILKTFLQQGIF